MSVHYTRAMALLAAGVMFGATAFAGSVSINQSGVISISFNPQYGAPMPESVAVVGVTNSPAAAPDGRSPVSYVVFSFLALDCVPGNLQLRLNCQSGRQWIRTLPLPTVGIWRQYIVEVDYLEGWTIAHWKKEALFQSDSLNIISVGLAVDRGGSTTAQLYMAVDFAVEGADWGTADTDGDRASNAAEVIAGTDPFDKADVLALRMLENPIHNQGFDVVWDSAPDRVYTIWRGTNLANAWVSQQSGIQASVPRNYYWDSGATGSGPYFYRVTVDNAAW